MAGFASRLKTPKKGALFYTEPYRFFNATPSAFCELIRKSFCEFGADGFEKIEFFIIEHDSETLDGYFKCNFRIADRPDKNRVVVSGTMRSWSSYRSRETCRAKIVFSR